MIRLGLGRLKRKGWLPKPVCINAKSAKKTFRPTPKQFDSQWKHANGSILLAKKKCPEAEAKAK
jgi:hypothetical protein